MTPPLLRKIKELVEAGATVVGPPPQKSPSLSAAIRECDEEVQELAGRALGRRRRQARPQNGASGKGRVFRQREPEKILARAGARAGFHQRRAAALHPPPRGRRGHLLRRQPQPAQRQRPPAHSGSRAKRPSFGGRTPGASSARQCFRKATAGRPWALPLGPSGSVFVVFRKPAGQGHRRDACCSMMANRSLSAKPGLAAAGADRARHLWRAGQTRSAPGTCGRRCSRRWMPANAVSRCRRWPKAMIPLPSMLKTLVVDYVIGGKHYTVKGQDPATVHLTAEGVGASGGEGALWRAGRSQADAGRARQAAAAAGCGREQLPVARMAEGDDPAFMVVKTLEVEYTLDGKRMSARGTDPDLIELKSPRRGTELVAELHAASAASWRCRPSSRAGMKWSSRDGNAPAIQRVRTPPGAGSHRPLVGAVRPRMGRAGAGHVRANSSPGAAMPTRGSSITPARRFTAPRSSCPRRCSRATGGSTWIWAAWRSWRR